MKCVIKFIKNVLSIFTSVCLVLKIVSYTAFTFTPRLFISVLDMVKITKDSHFDDKLVFWYTPSLMMILLVFAALLYLIPKLIKLVDRLYDKIFDLIFKKGDDLDANSRI